MSAKWEPHTSPDGRPYWFCAETQTSVWEKPEELKTPRERELSRLRWKEYETGGRKYWVHGDTNETTWECPREVAEIMSRPLLPEGLPARVPTAPASDQQQYPPMPRSSTPLNSLSGALVAPGGFNSHLPSRPLIPAPLISSSGAIILPDYQTHHDAEQAFMGMLSTIGVDKTWTWERTMRETITEPLYKALKTLAERKAAFERFVAESIATEKRELEQSLQRGRKGFHSALDKLNGGVRSAEGVKVWWSWEMRKDELKSRMTDAWDELRSDQERKTLFDEYIVNLKTKEATRQRDLRLRNKNKLTNVMQALSLDLAGTVRWRDAQEVIARTTEWQTDEELRLIDPLDVLAIFEEEVKKAEKESNELRHASSEEKRRRNRKAREAFVLLLEQLKHSGQITANSTWKSIYPLIESLEPYQNLLGNPGSSPLDLFWDMMDGVLQQAERDQKVVEKIFAEKGKPVDLEMNYDSFVALLSGDARLDDVDYATVKAVYDLLHDRVVKDERRREEKVLRLKIDDLRFAYKKLDPPVDLESTFEDNIARIETSSEFIAIEDEESRRTAFDKFIKTQRQKKDRRASVSDNDSIQSHEFGRRESTSHRPSDRDAKRRDHTSSDRRSRTSTKRERGGDTKHDEPSSTRESAAAEEVVPAPVPHAGEDVPKAGDSEMIEVEEGEIE